MEPNRIRRAQDGQISSRSASFACHGLPLGTPLRAQTGLRAVETLRPGDLIDTRNGGLQPIHAITVTEQLCQAIRFRAGCLGFGGPEQDIILPNAQPVLIQGLLSRALFEQNQGMILAGQLVDDVTIEDVGVRLLMLHQIDLGRARVMDAAGLSLGTEAAAAEPLRAVA